MSEHSEVTPFGKLWWEMEQGILRQLMEMTDEEIEEVIRQSKTLTDTNCWYATFQVAPILRNEAVAELHIRKRTREKASAESK